LQPAARTRLLLHDFVLFIVFVVVVRLLVIGVALIGEVRLVVILLRFVTNLLCIVLLVVVELIFETRCKGII
jgi:hypothetical protein